MTAQVLRARSPLRIECDLVGGQARSTTMARGHFFAPRPLPGAGHHLRIALVGTRMSLLGGDAIELQVRVGAGVTLEIIEPAGMVAYNARGQASSWHAHVSVEAGACLIWHGCPFVAAQGSNASRLTELSLTADARALLRETLVLGRSGEADVQVRNRLQVCLDDREILVDDLTISSHNRLLPGIVGSAKVVSSVLAAGWRPQGDAGDPRRFDLEQPAAVFRALGQAAHEADALTAPQYAAWRSELPTLR